MMENYSVCRVEYVFNIYQYCSLGLFVHQVSLLSSVLRVLVTRRVP